MVSLGGEEQRGRPRDLPAHVFDDLRINDHLVRLVLDTGSTHSVLFRSAAARLKLSCLPITGEARSSKEKGRLLGHTGVLQVLGPGDTMPVPIDFALFDFPLEPDGYDGLLGWSVLKHAVLSLDWENRRFVLSQAVPEEVQAAWTAWPLSPGAEVARLEPGIGEVNGSSIALATGGDFGVHLSPRRWEAWREAHPEIPETLEAMSSSCGVVVRRCALADPWTAGQVELHNVLVSPDPDLPALEVALGLQAMKQFNMALDGPNRKLYVQRRRVHPPDDYNKIGAVFVPSKAGSDALLAEVLEGSPAWRAGIRPGDGLLRIGDLDVTKWKTDPRVLPLARFWNGRMGGRQVLTLVREGKTFEAAVPLEDLFKKSADVPTP